jgi:hypothetical protein
MACEICASYVSDWLLRPMRFDEILYKDIHHKRLSNMIHEIIPIFNRFLQEISIIQIEMALMIMNVDISLEDAKEPEEIHKVAWTSIGKWCRFVSDDFNTVEVLLQENCIFKDKSPEFINIWIGYCMCNLTSVKEIHQEHSEARHLLLLKQMPTVIQTDIFDELYN